MNVQHISLYICGCLSFKTPTIIQGLLEKQQQQKNPMNLINEEPVNWTLTRCLQGFLTLNSNVTVLTYFCFLWLCRALYFFVKLFAGLVFCLVKIQKHFTFGAKRQQKKKKKKSNLAESECFCLCRGSAVCRAVTPPVISLTQRRQSDKMGTQRETHFTLKTLLAPMLRVRHLERMCFFVCSFFSLSSQTECFIC